MPRNPQQIESEIESDRAELASEQRAADAARVTSDPSLAPARRGIPAAFGNPDDITPAQSQDAFIRDFNSKLVGASDPANLGALDALHQSEKDHIARMSRAAQNDPNFVAPPASPTPDYNPLDVPQPHMEHPALPTPHTVPFDAKR